MARRLATVLGLGVALLALAAPSAYAAPYQPVADTQASPITERWRQLGGARSYLGVPTGAETTGPLPDTRIQRFAGGTLYAARGSVSVLVGAIEARFTGLSVTDQQRLGTPVGDEQDGWRAGSRQNRFRTGTIYWSPGTGAQTVYGAIDSRYAADPALREALGLPIGSETDGYAGSRRTAFEHGQIYWTPQLGAQPVQGAIAERYRQLGPEIGLPTGAEVAGRAPGSRVSTFTGGAIHWSAATGAQPVRGAIAERYRAIGAESSELGLPTGAEREVPGGQVSDFQYGRIGFDRASGQTRIEVTGGPESSPLWTECRLTLAGVDVSWPANNRSLTVVSGSGTSATLNLYLRRNSACGYDRVVSAPARERGTEPGSYPLTGAYPLGTNPYLGDAGPRIPIRLDAGPAALRTSDDPATTAGIAIGRDQLLTLLREVRPYDTITIAG